MLTTVACSHLSSSRFRLELTSGSLIVLTGVILAAVTRSVTSAAFGLQSCCCCSVRWKNQNKTRHPIHHKLTFSLCGSKCSKVLCLKICWSWVVFYLEVVASIFSRIANADQDMRNGCGSENQQIAHKQYMWHIIFQHTSTLRAPITDRWSFQASMSSII